MNLCKYKNALGIPYQGFHEKRIPILDLALNDVLGTIFLGILLWGILYELKIFTEILYNQIILCIAIMFAVGILLHRIFCVNTRLNKFIFGEIKD